MLEVFSYLFTYPSYSGGAIGNLLDMWAQQGVFSYLIPFLLIFALVFGILTQMKLFKQAKAINAIIALAVGLMSLQFDFVPRFFSEIFPRLGVGVAIILTLLILAGLFIDPSDSALMYSLLGIGAIIAVVVLVQTASALGWSSGYWWAENWPLVAGVVFILILVGIIVGSASDKPSKPYNPILIRQD